MPTITLDLGGATDMLQPLELHSDNVSHKAKALRKKKEQEMSRAAKERSMTEMGRGGSFAERARATQRAKLGLEEKKVEEEEIDVWVVFESFKAKFLIDNVETYGSVIREWIKSVESGKFVLKGKLENEDVKLAKLKKDLAEAEELTEIIKSWNAGKECSREEHKTRRIFVHKAEALWKRVLGVAHVLKSVDQAGVLNVTVEFGKDTWTAGRRIDVRGRAKVISWLK